MGMAALSVWASLHWEPAALVGLPCVLAAALLLFLALQPPIRISSAQLQIGRKKIPWDLVRRVDKTGWFAPLVVRLTLADGRRLLLVYPGDMDSSNSLLRHVRRFATEALIDGAPHWRFWSAQAEMCPSPVPGSGVLSKEDEDEVERLFQLLKTAGRLDSTNPAEEK